MGFTYLDLAILVVYLVGISLFGIKIAGKQTSTQDYFLGGRRMPWWAVSFAIVAAETSTLTFISIPGLAYLTNMNFLQVTFGYFLGRVIVAWILLPAYFRGELGTAYTFLANRFGTPMKNLASGIFMLTRLAADGVRLYATAIPLALILQKTFVAESLSETQFYIGSILIIAAVSLSYTSIGGLRAVIWMDVVQLIIYLVGAVAAVLVVASRLDGGLAAAIPVAAEAGKFQVFDLAFAGSWSEFFSRKYSVVASILGGAFLSMASHGIDQLIIQRLLAAGSLRASRKALVTTGAIVVAQFALFLFLGTMLFVFYRGAAMPSDKVFPRFIIEVMPTGLCGLIVAALLAAAISTLSSSISSLASVTMYDYVMPYVKRVHAGNEVVVSRVITLTWCLLLVGSATVFMNSPEAVVELALSIASFTYGGLLGTFFLGVLFKKPQLRHAIPAFLAGIGVMLYVILGTPIAWTWYTLIGASVTVLTGLVLTLVWPAEPAPSVVEKEARAYASADK
ncbi:MAG TPA: sodium:solute symporter [Phycisphaerae bacterium]|nr:sodium:solute symporter [Phycisphaerae bacterium]